MKEWTHKSSRASLEHAEGSRYNALGIRFPKVRDDSALVVALPWLPLLSATGAYRMAGQAALLVVVFALLLAFRWRPTYSHLRVAACAFLMLLVIGALQTSVVNGRTALQVVQILLVALAIEVGPRLQPRPIAVRICVASCAIWALMALLDLWMGTATVFGNPNTYGVAALCWGILPMKMLSVLNRRPRSVALMIGAIPATLLALISESRASIAAVVIAYAWPIINVLLGFRRLRTIVPLVVLVVPLIIVALVGAGALGEVRDYLPLIGEKSAFSGRDVIWLDIFAEVSTNNFRGFGLGSLPGGVLEGVYEGLSAHNGFLQILYQTGLVGLAVFLGACAFVIVGVSSRDDYGVSVGIFLGVLIHESFEVMLTQNHFGPGLLCWLVVTMPTALASGKGVDEVPAAS